MKATGIVRRIDEFGRIVVPKEIRTFFNVGEGDALEISYDDSGITLKPYQPNPVSDKIEDVIASLKADTNNREIVTMLNAIVDLLKYKNM